MATHQLHFEPTSIPGITQLTPLVDTIQRNALISTLMAGSCTKGWVATESVLRVTRSLPNKVTEPLDLRYLIVHRLYEADSNWNIAAVLKRATPLGGRQMTFASGLRLSATMSQSEVGAKFLLVAHPFIQSPRGRGRGRENVRLLLRMGRSRDPLLAAWAERPNDLLGSEVDAVLLRY